MLLETYLDPVVCSVREQTVSTEWTGLIGRPNRTRLGVTLLTLIFAFVTDASDMLETDWSVFTAVR